MELQSIFLLLFPVLNGLDVDYPTAFGVTRMATPDKEVPPVADPTVDVVNEVAILCFVMFGVVLCMWVLYMAMREDDPACEVYRVQLLCTSWAACSVGMHVLNKSLVVQLGAPGCITMVQLLISVIAFSFTVPAKLTQVNMRQLQYWLVVPVLFAGMVCTGFYTNEYFSLSLLMIIRNLSPLIVLPIEISVMPPEKRPPVTATVLLSILIMIAGTLVYCNGMGSISIVGLLFALLNMFLGVSNRVAQRRLLTTECKDLPSDVVMFVTNVLALLPTLVLACAASEWDKVALQWSIWTDPQCLVLLALSGLVGVGIGYLGFECQRVITATSFVVLQNSTKIIVVVVGICFFRDIVTVLTITGLSLSLGGSFMYGKIMISSQQDAEESELKHLVEKKSCHPEKDRNDEIILLPHQDQETASPEMVFETRQVSNMHDSTPNVV